MIGVVALSPAKRPSDRRPKAATYFGYDAPGNQEMMVKATTNTTLHRTVGEPPSRLQSHHGRHSSTTSRPATMWPEDHGDSHDRTCTRRRRSLQAKLDRPSLRLMTLRSGEPPLCMSPSPQTLYKDRQGNTRYILYHSVHSPL
jgi:hypothetical protein